MYRIYFVRLLARRIKDNSTDYATGFIHPVPEVFPQETSASNFYGVCFTYIYINVVPQQQYGNIGSQVVVIVKPLCSIRFIKIPSMYLLQPFAFRFFPIVRKCYNPTRNECELQWEVQTVEHSPVSMVLCLLAAMIQMGELTYQLDICTSMRG